jgi:hypoxanthine phosphoribosyltransferase
VIQINDKTFELFLSKEMIQKEINRLAEEINDAYKGKEVLFVAVLNGSFMFASDMMKCVDLDCEISFIKVSSYDGMNSTGEIKRLIGLTHDLSSKHIIILEDIVDTGKTLDLLLEDLKKKEPLSMKICTLLYKPEAHQSENKPDYVGFQIPNKFVVGYGLDYDEKGRNLEEIYQLVIK